MKKHLRKAGRLLWPPLHKHGGSLSDEKASTQTGAAPAIALNPDGSRKWGFGGGSRIPLLIYALCFIALIFLPVKMGMAHGDKGPNDSLPLLGYIESLCIKQSGKTLKNATISYAAAQTIARTVNMLQNIQLSIGVASMSPGKMLGAFSDGLDRISDGLFLVMGAVMVWRFFICIFFWLCLKILLPATLLLAICNLVRPTRIIGAMTGFAGRLSLAILIFVPAMAIINSHIDAAFDSSVIQKVEKIEKDPDLQNDLTGTKEKANSSVLDVIHDSAVNIADKINPKKYFEQVYTIKDKSAGMLENLQNALASFVLTTFIVPLIFLLLLWKIITRMPQCCLSGIDVSRLMLAPRPER